MTKINNKFILLGFGVIILTAGLFFLVPRGFGPSNLSDFSETEKLVISAFLENSSVKCNFVTDEMTGTAYIKKGKVRFSGTETNEGKKVSVILNDKLAYLWEDGKIEGISLDTSKYDIKEALMNVESFREQMEKYKPDCIRENISDDQFIPPSTVTFQDISSLIMEAASSSGSPIKVFDTFVN